MELIFKFERRKEDVFVDWSATLITTVTAMGPPLLSACRTDKYQSLRRTWATATTSKAANVVDESTGIV